MHSPALFYPEYPEEYRGGVKDAALEDGTTMAFHALSMALP